VDFDRAIELRRQGCSYKKIAETMGYAPSTIRNRFIKEYDKGNLLELSGYGGADPNSNPVDGYSLRRGPRLRAGTRIVDKLTSDEKWKVAIMMEKRGHRTLNGLLLSLLRKEINGQ